MTIEERRKRNVDGGFRFLVWGFRLLDWMKKKHGGLRFG